MFHWKGYLITSSYDNKRQMIDSNISTTIVAINTVTTTIVIIVDDIIPISCSTIDRFYGRSWDAVSIFSFLAAI